MYQPDEQSVLQFVGNVPSNVNPYSVVAQYLIASLTPPPAAPWVQHLGRAIVAGYLLMFFQSCFLVYLSIRTNSFLRFGFAEFNLFHTDSVSVLGICFAIYAALVITDFLFGEAVADGNLHVGAYIMIYGSKYMFIQYGGLVFLWVCACHCVSLKWRSGTQGPSFGKNSMPKIVPWIMHSILLISLFLIPPFIIWPFVSAAAQHNYIKGEVIAASERLLKSAATYSQKSYRQYQLLLLLLPLQKVFGRVALLSSSLLTGMKSYLIFIGITFLAYIPLIAYSLSKLFKRSGSEYHFNEKLVTLNGEEIERFRVISARTRKNRTLIVYRVSIALMAYLVHILALVWQIINARGWFFRNPDWLAASHLGLHGPSAIVGNIGIFLFIHSVQMAIPSSEEETGDHPRTFTKSRTGFNFCNFLIKSKTETPISVPKERHVVNSDSDELGTDVASYYSECVGVSQELMSQRQFSGTPGLDDHYSESAEITDLSTISDRQSAALSAKSTIIL